MMQSRNGESYQKIETEVANLPTMVSVEETAMPDPEVSFKRKHR